MVELVLGKNVTSPLHQLVSHHRATKGEVVNFGRQQQHHDNDVVVVIFKHFNTRETSICYCSINADDWQGIADYSDFMVESQWQQQHHVVAS